MHPVTVFSISLVQIEKIGHVFPTYASFPFCQREGKREGNREGNRSGGRDENGAVCRAGEIST
jgi:hypothetical protein